VEEKGVKYRTKGREHQVNYLAQWVKDKGKKGGGEATKATLPPTCAVLTKMGVRVYWERKELGFIIVNPKISKLRLKEITMG
jgi:hypothetical protein